MDGAIHRAAGPHLRAENYATHVNAAGVGCDICSFVLIFMCFVCLFVLVCLLMHVTLVIQVMRVMQILQALQSILATRYQ